MKKLLIATLSLLLIFAEAATAIVPQQTTIPTGTPVTLRLRDTISTTTAKKGNRVLADVDAPAVFPPGTIVVGELAEAKRSGLLFGRAKLKFNLDTIQLPNGQQIKIKAVLHRIGNYQINKSQLAANSTIGRDVKTGVWATFGGALIGVGAGALASKDEGRAAMIQTAQIGGKYGAAGGAAIGLLSALLRRGEDLEISSGTEMVLILSEAVRF